MKLRVLRSRKMGLVPRCVFSLLARQLSFASQKRREAEAMSAAEIGRQLRMNRTLTVGPALEFLQICGLACETTDGWRVASQAAWEAVPWLADVVGEWFIGRKPAEKEKPRCWVDHLAYHLVSIDPARTLRQNYVAARDDGKRSARRIARQSGVSPRTVRRHKKVDKKLLVAMTTRPPERARVLLEAKLRAKVLALMEHDMVDPRPERINEVMADLMLGAAAIPNELERGKIMCSIINDALEYGCRKSDWLLVMVVKEFFKVVFKHCVSRTAHNRNHTASIIVEARQALRMLLRGNTSPYANTDGELSTWRYRRAAALNSE